MNGHDMNMKLLFVMSIWAIRLQTDRSYLGKTHLYHSLQWDIQNQKSTKDDNQNPSKGIKKLVRRWGIYILRRAHSEASLLKKFKVHGKKKGLILPSSAHAWFWQIQPSGKYRQPTVSNETTPLFQLKQYDCFLGETKGVSLTVLF